MKMAGMQGMDMGMVTGSRSELKFVRMKIAVEKTNLLEQIRFGLNLTWFLTSFKSYAAFLILCFLT